MKRLWQLHSWLGLIAGLGLIIIGITGTLLVFHEEIDGVLSPDLVMVTPSAAGRLPYDQLMAAVNKALPDYQLGGWRLSDKPERADQIYVIQHGTTVWKFVWLDPFTGTVRGPVVENNLTSWLLELHYAFLADHTGQAIAGVLGALLCLLGVTGVWLYRGFWRNFFTLRWGRSARIFFADVHKMVGISSVAFNLILGFTGAWWNLSHIIGDLIQGGDEEAVKASGPQYAATISFDALLQRAKQELPGFRELYLGFPESPEEDITFYGGFEKAGVLRSPYGSTVMFKAKTGELSSTMDIRGAGAWDQILDSFTPLHYGTFGGLPVKILWSLGGLAPGVLAITGFLMWYRRHKRRTVSPARGTVK